MSDIDVVEKVLSDQPDLPVHVPYAGNTSPGIASFNTRDFIVEENGAVQLSKDVQGLTEEAVQAAANAKQSEQNAANSASQAKAARDEIVNNRYVERAEQAADEAERQARYASNSAAAASQYRQGALDAANSALQSKQSAETAAEEAEAALNDIVTNDYVGKAEQAANDAKQSAISASNEADRAQQIADGIGSTFKPQGTIKFEELPAQPGPDYKGFLWDISNAFMTDDRFIVGAGEYAPAGSDVSCIEMADGTYKYNISAGLYDLSPYAKKTEVSAEATARQEADENLQSQIDSIAAGTSLTYEISALTLSNNGTNAFKSEIFAISDYTKYSAIHVNSMSAVGLSSTIKSYLQSAFSPDVSSPTYVIYDLTLHKTQSNLFVATVGAIYGPDERLYNIGGTIIFVIDINENGGAQLFGTVLTDSKGAAIQAIFDNSGNPIANKYVKPATGIPESDLASAVQTSLGKADTALQSVPLATSSVVGGVKPASKTTEMTQPVGVDSNGALWTAPGGGGIEQNEVIAVESLPTATADSPDFVQTPDGKLYRKQTIQNDSLIGTWQFGVGMAASIPEDWTFDFTCDGVNYTGILVKADLESIQYQGSNPVTVYQFGWLNDKYKTITITDISGITDQAAFTEYMTSKATKLPTYSYEEVGASAGGGITNAQVIEYADELPTASETSPNFVQTPDGTLYRKKAVESGGLLGTWVFNDNADCTTAYTFNISFSCSAFPSTNFTGITVTTSDRFGPWNVFYNYSGGTEIAYNGTSSTAGIWVNTAYKTIQITDISTLTNVDEFTTWLTANATGGGASVSYEYVPVGEIVIDLGTFTDPPMNGSISNASISQETFDLLSINQNVCITLTSESGLTLKLYSQLTKGAMGDTIAYIGNAMYQNTLSNILQIYTIEVSPDNVDVSCDLAFPIPAAADNGKVLGVANGAYALQEASGGGTVEGFSITVASTKDIYLRDNKGLLTLISANTPTETYQNITEIYYKYNTISESVTINNPSSISIVSDIVYNDVAYVHGLLQNNLSITISSGGGSAGDM